MIIISTILMYVALVIFGYILSEICIEPVMRNLRDKRNKRNIDKIYNELLKKSQEED